MSRLRVRGFLPVLLSLVIAALALLALTQPQSEAVEPRLGAENDGAKFVPAMFVATEAPLPAKTLESAKMQAPRTPPVTTAEPSLPADSLVHPARAGEAVTAIARMYLPQTPYMSTHELEAAIRPDTAIAPLSIT